MIISIRTLKEIEDYVGRGCMANITLQGRHKNIVLTVTAQIPGSGERCMYQEEISQEEISEGYSPCSCLSFRLRAKEQFDSIFEADKHI